jgi:hypothetical protein
MAFADPQSVTINAVANSLARTSSGVNTGSFSKDDGSVQLIVRHAYGKRTQRQIQLRHTKIAADPLQPSTNKQYSMSVSLNVNTPTAGYTNTEIKQICDALTSYLTASSGAKVTQLLGGEN